MAPTKKKEAYINKEVENDCGTNITDLPDELVSLIFSELPKQDLSSNVREVCHSWKNLSMDPLLWKNIDINENTCLISLRNWLTSNKSITSVVINERRDVDSLLKELSYFCQDSLEDIVISNSNGTRQHKTIHSVPLCNFVNKCRKLKKVHFTRGIKFRSVKFLKLLIENSIPDVNVPITLRQHTALEEYLIHSDIIRNV